MTEKTPIIPNKRLQQTQAQVNEVVDIMRVNVDKVLERDKNLSELDGRADALQAGASQFEASAGKLKRKFWWKNCKMLIVIGILVCILVTLVIVWIVYDQKNKLQRYNGPSVNHTTAIGNGVAGPAGQEIVPNWTEAPENELEPEVLESPEFKNTFTPSPAKHQVSSVQVKPSNAPDQSREVVKIGESPQASFDDMT
uniref:VAMP 1 vesicle-associated membrane protein 1 n=1 Tax=Cryptocotyle lingua TaxID=66766 RepID=A0A7U0YET5_9TREM|nr:VAMP 1 vesicle-associated membrane protein 1 [Cryptocotyle lingua]